LELAVVPYRPAWREEAQALTAMLGSALGARARRIEHIGSTSIPGMAAKDVLDLQISVDDLAEAARIFDEPLARLGFDRTPYRADHVPAGRDDDPGRWAKRLWARRGRPPDVNLHVRLAGSPNERLALLFRDWFRAHPAATPAYASFKRRLAAEIGDVGRYTDIKDPVVDVIIAAAEEWAAAIGWTAWGVAPGRAATPSLASPHRPDVDPLGAGRGEMGE
jgi:GrpB-like predicted nucleotidyltransferase (UPF0157 family)